MKTMKKALYLNMATSVLAFSLSFGQEIPQSQVPSLVLNSFQQDFPKATDVEWELKIDRYEVEFEIDRNDRDHEIIYNQNGEILRHKEEISAKDLPAKVLDRLNADFKVYRIKDVEKIEIKDKTIYKLDAKSYKEEWELTINSEGKILRQVAD